MRIYAHVCLYVIQCSQIRSRTPKIAKDPLKQHFFINTTQNRQVNSKGCKFDSIHSISKFQS